MIKNLIVSNYSKEGIIYEQKLNNLLKNSSNIEDLLKEFNEKSVKNILDSRITIKFLENHYNLQDGEFYASVLDFYSDDKNFLTYLKNVIPDDYASITATTINRIVELENTDNLEVIGEVLTGITNAALEQLNRRGFLDEYFKTPQQFLKYVVRKNDNDEI